MMLNKLIFSAVCLVLMGCASPRDRCVNAATQNLRTVEVLIADTQGNINRGFGYVSDVRYTTGIDFCFDPWGNVRTCTSTRTVPTTKPVAIDIDTEKKKLAGLKKQREALIQNVKAPIEECNARFPAPEVAPALD
ncbi:MAG: hypothetical protein ABJO27_10470 [Pseudoruegeria sp.]